MERQSKTRCRMSRSNEQAHEHEHHLVRALRESREWEMLNSAANGKTRSKVAYRRLAQRFHPDRAKPQDKEAATWCMQEINRIWGRCATNSAMTTVSAIWIRTEQIAPRRRSNP